MHNNYNAYSPTFKGFAELYLGNNEENCQN